MTIAITILLALTLLLAPLVAAQPEGPRIEALVSFEWASFLCAGTFLAVLLAGRTARRGGPFAARFSSAEKAFLVLLGLAFLSIPARLFVQHSTAYFGLMVRGWSVLAADFALFALARRVAGNRVLLYGLVLAAVAGSAWVADLGVQEYLTHLRAGDPQWRIFVSSSPDFLAGYFVLLLPVTLALFLEVPSLRGMTPLLRGMASLIVGVVLLLQLAAFLTTQSRFGLLSLAVALLVFAAGLVFTVTRQGMVLPQATRFLLCVFGAGLVLGGAVFAKPVLLRLQNLHDNSAAFRIWTWRGSLHMALDNPVLGTGIGAWTDLYPRYALTGFTRLAHSSYLQMADECGVPALLSLLAALVFVGMTVIRGFRRLPGALPNSQEQDGFLPRDNRLLLCGLAGALAGGIVQNLIDSDWSVFFLGAFFWTFAGLAAGLAERQAESETKSETKPPATLSLIAAGSVAAALLLLTGTQGIGAGYAVTADSQRGADPGGAAESFRAARAWDPVNGRYPGDLGFQVYYSRLADLESAETALNAAIALEPDSVNYRRLGTVLQAAGRKADAVAAYENGLRAEPNSVELLLRLARLSLPAASLQYYRRLSDLEMTPVGTARALGESVEPGFAYADAAMGSAPGQPPVSAAVYYSRAATLLETYAAQGGSTNIQREVLSGGRPDPQTDTDLSTLYSQVMSRWIAAVPPGQKAALQARQVAAAEKFQAVIEEAAKEASKPGML